MKRHLYFIVLCVLALLATSKLTALPPGKPVSISGSQVWTNSAGIIQPTTNTAVLVPWGLTIGSNSAAAWGYAGRPGIGESIVAVRDVTQGEPNNNELVVGIADSRGIVSFLDLFTSTNSFEEDFAANEVTAGKLILQPGLVSLTLSDPSSGNASAVAVYCGVALNQNFLDFRTNVNFPYLSWGSNGVLTTISVKASAGFASGLSNRAAPATISVTSSPFSYTNTTGVNDQVFLDANGATTAVTYNGTAIFGTLAGGDHTITLQTNEWITVTYSVATPSMKHHAF